MMIKVNMIAFAIAVWIFGDSAAAQKKKVEICFNGETRKVKQGKVDKFIRRGATTGPCTMTNDVGNILNEMNKMAEQFGIGPLDLDGAGIITGFGATSIAATRSDLASIPGREILAGEGMFMGLSWMDIPGMEPGFYSCKPHSMNDADGSVSVDMVNMETQETMTVPGRAILGERVENGRSAVAGDVVPESFDPNITLKAGEAIPAIGPKFKLTVWWLCDNGLWVCVTISFSIG